MVTDCRRPRTNLSAQVVSLLFVILIPSIGRTQTADLDRSKIESPARTVVRKPVVVNEQPNATMAGENATKSQRVIVKKPPLITRNGETYTIGQVSKLHTTLVLAYQDDIRANYVILNTKDLLDAEQTVAAKKIAREYDAEFNQILKNRTEFLQVATGDDDVEDVLLGFRLDVVDLLRKIRRRIHREVLTREQKIFMQKKYAPAK